MRTFNIDKVIEATSQYADSIEDFYPEEWLENIDNIALINENDDVMLFQYIKDGTYFGHYFLFSRGREAVRAASEFIQELFAEYPVNRIVGLTPITNLGARWMNKRINFKSQGVMDTIAGPCELVVQTKEEWENFYGRSIRR